MKGKPLILKFLANFTHVMAIMLWLAGIGAFIAKMPELGIAVWSVNIINGGFSFFQEFRAEKATQALKKILPSQSRVMRNGEEASILAQDLVPGDVIFLQEGDNIPADCRLLNSADLRVNQSTLTGESHPVNRSAEPVSGEDMTRTDIPNLIFAGTFVALGSGKAIVYATGMNTNFGHRPDDPGPERGTQPAPKEMKTRPRLSQPSPWASVLSSSLPRLMVNIPLLDSFIFTLGMVVAFVPEGMSPTVTLALAMGTQRMAKRNALIKKLSAVETLGCTNVICSDKTGTLTQNEMTVRAVWVPASYASKPYAGREIAVSGTGYEPTGTFTENGAALDPRSQYALSQVILTQAKCNTARLLPPETRPDGTKTGWKVLGDPTEAALLVLADKAGYSRDDLQSDQNVAELPFDSRRKRMSVVHLQRVDGNLQRVAYVKGGIREVLDACSSVRVNDQVIPISPEWVDFIMARNDAYARQGLRVLAAAARVLPRELSEYQVESIETDLTFLGMVAMMDPPRADVTEAVKKCHRAGIRIIMITGIMVLRQKASPGG